MGNDIEKKFNDVTEGLSRVNEVLERVNEQVYDIHRYIVAGGRDELYPEAVKLAEEKGGASSAMLQRHLRIGYARAICLIDLLTLNGIVEEPDGAKPRKFIKQKV